MNLPSNYKMTRLTLILRRDLHHVILELRRVTVLTAGTRQMQESIKQGPGDHHLELGTRMDQQYQDLGDRIDALGRLILKGQFQDGSHPEQSSKSSEKDINTQDLRIIASHRIPCRKWCPCSCHAKRKLKLTVPGMMESVIGKMFFGYSGLPVLIKPCDFRGCRDRQNATATMEYWFPWWLVSVNLKMHLTYLPWTGTQFQLSAIRRVPDDSQSISFAIQGNIDGLKNLFDKGLFGPRDVSDSRGYTLMRVSYSQLPFLL